MSEFRVTVEDIETGETETMVVHSGDYLLIPFAPCYLSGTQKYLTTGTVQLTVKDWRPQGSARKVLACFRTGCKTPATGICCTSHDKAMCHEDYRRSHFVEKCIEGCEFCAAEGLPVVLGPREVAQ